jgi:plastocyanin
MRKLLVIGLAGALALAGLSASSTAGPLAETSARAKRVLIGDNSFSPRKVRVRRGGRVTYLWRGKRRHDVYFYAAPEGARPRTCRLRRDGRCVRRFRKRGAYRFVCTRHGSMVGKVTAR